MTSLKQIGIVSTVLSALLNSASAGGVDVLSSRYDNERTGANLKETLLHIGNVNAGTFGKRHSYRTDCVEGVCRAGDIYAQPLYVSNVRVPGRGLVNILLVASTNNFVFAFDADADVLRRGASSVAPVWVRNLGTPPSIDDIRRIGKCTGACVQNMGVNLPEGTIEGVFPVTPSPFTEFTTGNMRGNVGIMSTPVIDRSRGIVFLVSKVLVDSQHTAYRLHALDLTTGEDHHGTPPFVITAQVLGINFDPNTHNQRPGLALARGQIIVAFGSYADVMTYRGWVMSFRYDAARVPGAFARTGIFVTTPGGSLLPDCAGAIFLGAKGDAEYNRLANNCAHGGIWMSGRAPAVDADGTVLLMIGNGKNDMSQSAAQLNFGNSLVKLNPVNLSVLDFFTPDNHIYLNAADLDLGGSGPMIIPQSRFIVGGGKQGVMHVWLSGNLGKFTIGNPAVIQTFPTGPEVSHNDRSVDHPGGITLLEPDKTHHAGHIMGGPVYWSRPPHLGGSRLYNWSENTNLRSYQVNPALSPPIVAAPIADTGFEIQKGHPGGILTLSANGADFQTAIVWAATYDPGGLNLEGDTLGALNRVRPGILRAYNAITLAPLWTSENNANRDRLGDYAKFTPPTVANGRVYMATFSNQVIVYGLLKHPYRRPTEPAVAELMPLLLDEGERPTAGLSADLMQLLLDDSNERPVRPPISEMMQLLDGDD